jgi:hypothetical protein
VTGAAWADDSTGVYGQSAGAGSLAMYGLTTGSVDSNNVAPIGVLGVANDGIGVVGISVYSSNVYSSLTGGPGIAGVWGDSGSQGTSTATVWSGVMGTADDNSAGIFINNSDDTRTTLYVLNRGSGGTGLFKTFKASTPDGTCGIGSGGSLTCTGQVKTLATAGGGFRKVETYAMQSPENWMEDFGTGLMQRGVAAVKIDPGFAETVSETADYHVFITPNGDSKGLYVIRKTATSFEVRESGGGTSSLSFDYRIVARRRGYEAQRLTDVTDRFNAEQKTTEPLLRAGAAGAARPETNARPASPRVVQVDPVPIRPVAASKRNEASRP